MTIDELKEIQKDSGCTDTHLVCIEPTRFVIAHTDEERSNLHPLTDCDFHRWMLEMEGPPEKPGIYAALPDFWEGWELIPFDGSNEIR